METKKLIHLTGVNSGISKGMPVSHSLAEFLATRSLLSLEPCVKADQLICIDYSSEAGRHIKQQGLMAESCTLVRMEPSVVLPANFHKLRSKQFRRIITVGGTKSEDFPQIHWPLVWPGQAWITEIAESDRTDRVVLINGNKMSFMQGELYSLRREAIRAIENLDLYGTEWDSALLHRLFIATRSFAHAVLSLKVPSVSGIRLWFQSYPKSLGSVEDKLVTMSKYKYAVVIENSAEYMSEKLMEALFAGCIPIYVGPDPQEYGIPNNLVIWSKPNIDSICSSLAEATTWDFRDFHSRLEVFLGSSEVRDLWDFEKVYQKMLELIQSGSK